MSVHTGQAFTPGGATTPGSPFYNVKTYGAVGDGATDDTGAIQAAITAAGNQGQVFFPQGTYITQKLTIDTGLWFVGAGYQATILKLKNNTNDNLIETKNFSSLTGGNTTGGPFNWGIIGMTLDGNGSNQTQGHCLAIYGYGYTLDKFRMRNAKQLGLYSEWSTSSNSPGNDSMEAMVSNFKIHDCTTGGFKFKGPHDSYFNTGVVYSNGDSSSGSVQMAIGDGGGGAAGTIFNDVHGWGTLSQYVARIQDQAIVLEGCGLEGGTVAELRISSNSNQINDTRIFTGGAAVTGIIIDNSAIKNRIRAKVENMGSAVIDLSAAGVANDIEIYADYFTVTPPTNLVVGSIPGNTKLVLYGTDGSSNVLSKSQLQLPFNFGLGSGLTLDNYVTSRQFSFNGGNVNIAAPTLTDGTISENAANIAKTFTPSADTSQRIWGLRFQVFGTGSHNFSDSNSLTGMEGFASFDGSGTMAGATGVLAYARTNGSSGTLSQAVGLLAFGNSAASGTTLTTSYGVKIQNSFGSGTIVNNYGLYINAITGGTTLNYSIFTNTGLVFLGDDVIFNGIPYVYYGSYYSVQRDGSYATHRLIGVTFTNSNDQTQIYTPGNSQGNPILRLQANNASAFGGVNPTNNGAALQLLAGAQTSINSNVGGIIYDHYADAGNTHTDGATFDDLFTDTTPGSLLNANGDKLIAEYSGIFVGSTSSKEVKVLFAGTTILDTGSLSIATGESWDIQLIIIRESSTVVRCNVSFKSTTSVGASVNQEVNYTRITGLTLTGTNILKITGVSGGVGAAANDVVAKLAYIAYHPGI